MLNIDSLRVWYDGLRPDLQKPTLRRLWSLACRLRRAVCGTRYPLDKAGLLIIFREAVSKALSRFEPGRPPENTEVTHLMTEEDRVYCFVKESIKWRVLEYRRRLQHEEKMKKKNHYKWAAARWRGTKSGPVQDVDQAPAPNDNSGTLRAVGQAIATLPEREQKLISARYVERKKYDEIAKEFSIDNRHQVKREIERIKESLRTILENEPALWR